MDAEIRERIEVWLEDEMPTVREYCRSFRVAVDAWPEQAELAVFVDLALRRHVDDLLVTLRARSEWHALRLVAPRFGLNPDTVRRRWLRHRKAA